MNHRYRHFNKYHSTDKVNQNPHVHSYLFLEIQISLTGNSIISIFDHTFISMSGTFCFQQMRKHRSAISPTMATLLYVGFIVFWNTKMYNLPDIRVIYTHLKSNFSTCNSKLNYVDVNEDKNFHFLPQHLYIW